MGFLSPGWDSCLSQLGEAQPLLSGTGAVAGWMVPADPAECP